MNARTMTLATILTCMATAAALAQAPVPLAPDAGVNVLGGQAAGEPTWFRRCSSRR